MKPAYLISGTDRAKIEQAVQRLRARAEREGGPGSLETFDADRSGAPDAEEVVAALPAMSLTAARRYLLAEHVWRWNAKALERVTAALGSMPGDVTLVLVAALDADAGGADRARAKRVIAKLEGAVEAAGGQHIGCQAPRGQALPRWLAEQAAQRGFELDPDAARLLIERQGEGTARLASELDRLATWADPGGRVEIEDLEAMTADTSEQAIWALSDAIVAGDAAGATAVAEELARNGEPLTSLVYAAARRLREAHLAASGLEAGQSSKQLESSLPMHPYAAKMLLRSVRDTPVERLRAAACAVADLEWWSRGGSDYPDDVALALAIRRAAGASA